MNLLLVWSDVIRFGGGGREGGAAIGRDSRKTVSSSSGKGCILLSPRPSGPSLVLLLMEKSLESLEPPAASESMEELPSTAKVLLPSSSQGGRIGEVSFSMLTLLLAVAHGLPSLSRSPSVRVLKKLKRPPSSLLIPHMDWECCSLTSLCTRGTKGSPIEPCLIKAPPGFTCTKPPLSKPPATALAPLPPSCFTVFLLHTIVCFSHCFWRLDQLGGLPLLNRVHGDL